MTDFVGGLAGVGVSEFNCHSHRLRAPNPVRTDRMPRDLFARLNTLICVMDWRWPSSPVARALASSSGTPNASTASAPRRNSVTRTSERRRMSHSSRIEGSPLLACLRFLHRWIATSRTQPEEAKQRGRSGSLRRYLWARFAAPQASGEKQGGVLRGCLTEKIAGKNRRTLSHERFASERREFP